MDPAWTLPAPYILLRRSPLEGQTHATHYEQPPQYHYAPAMPDFAAAMPGSREHYAPVTGTAAAAQHYDIQPACACNCHTHGHTADGQAGPAPPPPTRPVTPQDLEQRLFEAGLDLYDDARSLAGISDVTGDRFTPTAGEAYDGAFFGPPPVAQQQSNNIANISDAIQAIYARLDKIEEDNAITKNRLLLRLDAGVRVVARSLIEYEQGQEPLWSVRALIASTLYRCQQVASLPNLWNEVLTLQDALIHCQGCYDHLPASGADEAAAAASDRLIDAVRVCLLRFDDRDVSQRVEAVGYEA